MLSQTGFTEEVLLDEVGLLRCTGGEATKTVHTHGTVVTVAAFRQDF